VATRGASSHEHDGGFEQSVEGFRDSDQLVIGHDRYRSWFRGSVLNRAPMRDVAAGLSVHGYPREVAHGLERRSKVDSCCGQLAQGCGIGYAKRADAGAPQLGEVGTAAEVVSQISGEGPDVGPTAHDSLKRHVRVSRRAE
jgi:hypothetical protein